MRTQFGLEEQIRGVTLARLERRVGRNVVARAQVALLLRLGVVHRVRSVVHQGLNVHVGKELPGMHGLHRVLGAHDFLALLLHVVCCGDEEQVGHVERGGLGIRGLDEAATRKCPGRRRHENGAVL